MRGLAEKAARANLRTAHELDAVVAALAELPAETGGGPAGTVDVNVAAGMLEISTSGVYKLADRYPDSSMWEDRKRWFRLDWLEGRLAVMSTRVHTELMRGEAEPDRWVGP